MGIFSFLFGKKKKKAKYVIEEEDDQEQFLKSDEEMNAPTTKKSKPKTSEAKAPEVNAPEKTTESSKDFDLKKNESTAETHVATASKKEEVTKVKAEAAKDESAATAGDGEKVPQKAAKEDTNDEKKPPNKSPAKSKEAEKESALEEVSETQSAKKSTDSSKAADKVKVPEKKPALKKETTPKNDKKEKEASKPAEKDGEETVDYEMTVAVEEGKETRNGKFDVRRGKDGRFFFSLYASNHMPIAFSQMYSTSSAAMNGINSVISNSPKAPTEDTTLKSPTSLPFPKWEIYIDRAGEYRFRLYATNGQCVCHSYHGYSTKSGCKGGIDSIKRFAQEAKVNKSYKQA